MGCVGSMRWKGVIFFVRGVVLWLIREYPPNVARNAGNEGE